MQSYVIAILVTILPFLALVAVVGLYRIQSRQIAWRKAETKRGLQESLDRIDARIATKHNTTVTEVRRVLDNA